MIGTLFWLAGESGMFVVVAVIGVVPCITVTPLENSATYHWITTLMGLAGTAAVENETETPPQGIWPVTMVLTGESKLPGFVVNIRKALAGTTGVNATLTGIPETALMVTAPD